MVSCPIPHKIGRIRQSLGLVWKKIIMTQQNHYIHQSKEMYYNAKKLKQGLVVFYDIWSGNREGLFSKEKVSKGGDKKNVKKDKWGSTECKQANNIYSAQIKIRIKGALSPGARTGIGGIDR